MDTLEILIAEFCSLYTIRLKSTQYGDVSMQ